MAAATGACSRLVRFPEADWPDRCEAADLNGDGRVDIVVTEENRGIAADALACWWKRSRWPGRRRPDSAASYDRDPVHDEQSRPGGHGRRRRHRHSSWPSTGGSIGVAVWENDGLGAFRERRVGEGRENHLGGCVADLDGDGDLDVVGIADDDFANLHLWRNTASQSPTVKGRR